MGPVIGPTPATLHGDRKPKRVQVERWHNGGGGRWSRWPTGKGKWP
ncbi:hypothetical protein ES332_A11G370000v1 [Gossypium tomentosum]|uniref:Uncharacterized protein n=1 Tax=Gossypium tomentosum TaxID=34277 RepID=A0A5D2NJE5_GOSTO|nr:hypothetical protein ES332_A11G370000v1 [Gossypium tomentosum]